MAVNPSIKLTYEDYALFPEDGKQREIIDGALFVNPSPNTRHQRLVHRLSLALGNHLQKHGGGEVLTAPFDVIMSDIDVVQPDLLFLASGQTGLTDSNFSGAPSLVIEVVSDPARDRRLKRDLYARGGVGEYWIVDPDGDRVEVYRPGSGGSFDKPAILEAGDFLETPLLTGLRIDLADLFRRP